ncbi:MAG: hypothetical protein ACRD25_13160 [Terracidiphilus sp.]
MDGFELSNYSPVYGGVHLLPPKFHSISGPLQAVGGGELELHADEILQNGTPEKGLMDLTGKNLADYAHFKNAQSLNTRDNDIYIHPDPLPNLSGQVTGVSLNDSSVTLRFSSQPCR